ncbi:MAG: hypothetical protein KJP23_17720 [Deltaproteobacteria bacterium]|nr:hypothetical protein [Deltaproteobacteria bacterium]
MKIMVYSTDGVLMGVNERVGNDDKANIHIANGGAVGVYEIYMAEDIPPIPVDASRAAYSPVNMQRGDTLCITPNPTHLSFDDLAPNFYR